MLNGVDCVISSPPFLDQMPSHANFTAPHDTGKRMDTDYETAYGQTAGQLGAMKPGTLPEDTMNKETQRDCVFHEWANCYDSSWQSLIVEDAFAHIGSPQNFLVR
jgi:hypothetical protein